MAAFWRISLERLETENPLERQQEQRGRLDTNERIVLLANQIGQEWTGMSRCEHWSLRLAAGGGEVEESRLNGRLWLFRSPPS